MTQCRDSEGAGTQVVVRTEKGPRSSTARGGPDLVVGPEKGSKTLLLSELINKSRWLCDQVLCRSITLTCFTKVSFFIHCTKHLKEILNFAKVSFQVAA
jgi:hypothetical protein